MSTTRLQTLLQEQGTEVSKFLLENIEQLSDNEKNILLQLLENTDSDLVEKQKNVLLKDMQKTTKKLEKVVNKQQRLHSRFSEYCEKKVEKKENLDLLLKI